MAATARVPLTAIKPIGGAARRGPSPYHAAPHAPVMKPVVPTREDDALEVGIPLLERERRLRAYKRNDKPFSVKEFADLLGVSTSLLYPHLAKIGTRVSDRRWSISIPAAAAYIEQMNGARHA